MRALVVSDLHFGAWTSDPLLAREFALERLAPHLDGIDELVLLGDVFELWFAPLEQAFAEAEPFLDLVGERMRGRRVVYLAGNHDHHVVVRTLRSLSELKVATGADGDDLAGAFEREHRHFVQRYLERKLEGVEIEMAYPTYWVGRTLLFHGHYLDAHIQDSLANRILNKVVRTIGGAQSADSMTVEDYEAVVAPLSELCFTVAQMPGGTDTQQGLLASFERVARYLRTWGVAKREARRLWSWAQEALRAGTRRGEGADRPLASGDRGRSITVTLQEAGAALQSDVAERGESAILQLAQPGASAPISASLNAYGQVVRNLGWARETASMIFGHTHQPLDGVFEPQSGPVRFWNTGSWIFQPKLATKDSYRNYLDTSWPGTALLVDTDQAAPQLIETLADQNPLRGGRPDPALRRRDQFNERALAYERDLFGG